jgi:hypothetical protein
MNRVFYFEMIQSIAINFLDLQYQFEKSQLGGLKKGFVERILSGSRFAYITLRYNVPIGV